MTALARGLARRGHDVCFLTLEDNVPVFEAAGVASVGYRSRLFPAGEFKRRTQALSRMQGTEATEAAADINGNLIEAVFEAGLPVLREMRPDAFVTDSVSSGFNTVASHLGLPFFLVSCAVHCDTSGYTPLPVYDWPYETGPEARARYRQGIADFARTTGVVEAVAMRKQQWGLPPALNLHARELAHLTQVPREFDFPSDHWPRNLHHCGPLIDPTARRGSIEFPWERLTGEPLVYASLGTLQDGLPEVLRTIIAAAAAPGRQLVIALTSDAHLDELGPLPQNTIVRPQIPQMEVLRRAALCITHAGLNTVLESLYYGVPMVALPITFDQPGVAARIAYTGTGEFIPKDRVTVERLRDCVARVLTESLYRENAQRLQQAIRANDGVTCAADIVEKRTRARTDGKDRKFLVAAGRAV